MEMEEKEREEEKKTPLPWQFVGFCALDQAKLSQWEKAEVSLLLFPYYYERVTKMKKMTKSNETKTREQKDKDKENRRRTRTKRKETIGKSHGIFFSIIEVVFWRREFITISANEI